MAGCPPLAPSPVPLINLRTSLKAVEDADALLKRLSSLLARQTGKPEAYVMALLDTNVPMTFAGTSDPSAYVEIKSIGALTPPAMTAACSALISEHTGIPIDRIYIGFEDVRADAWGWNGTTFG